MPSHRLGAGNGEADGLDGRDAVCKQLREADLGVGRKRKGGTKGECAKLERRVLGRHDVGRGKTMQAEPARLVPQPQGALLYGHVL